MLSPQEIARIRAEAGASPISSSMSTGSLADDLGVGQPVPKVPAPNPSFTGIDNMKISGGTPKIAAPGTPSTPDILKNTAKSFVSGTIESGKDIAAAIGGNTMAATFNALPEGDQQYLTTLIQLRNKNAQKGDKTQVEHYQNLIKNYRASDGQSITEVFPALNKSTEQVLGDFASLALEVTGGGSLATSGAEKAAQVAKEGVPLAQRLIQGAKTGGKYGASFGITGAMQANEDVTGIIKSGIEGGAAGALLGAGAEGAFGKRPAGEILAKESKGLDNTIGKIIQGSEKDIPGAKTALSNIDISGVKTYKDLGTKLNDRISLLSEKLDTEVLAKKPEPIPWDEMVSNQKVGGQTVTHNYVEDAIGQLKMFYEKTNDQVGLAEMKALEKKARGEILNPDEINILRERNKFILQEEKRKMEMGTYKLGERQPTKIVDQTGEYRKPGVNFYTGGDRRNIPGGTKKAPYKSLDDFLSDPLENAKLDPNSVEPKSAGLTIKEINDLAKLHGQELSGYNANGELASGLTKQAAENTRAGLKGTARQISGDKAYEAIDDQIHHLINTRDLVGEVADKVNQLKQKVTERGFGEKVGRLIFQITDKLTGGGLKGFVQSFVPRGEGLKIMNALDLEKGLNKNLKFVESLLNSNETEETIFNKLQKFLKSTGETMLKSTENIPNKEGGFISVGGKTFAQIPEKTKSEMVQVIDYLRTGKKSANIEDTLSRLSEKYNIDQDWSNAKIANAFEDLIDKTKTN